MASSATPKAYSKSLSADPLKKPASHTDARHTKLLEEAIYQLESCVIRVLEAPNPADGGADPFAERQLQNIATPVSLALAEQCGPRTFHHHYRHDPDNHDILKPVMEPPLDVLARACEEALTRARALSGIQDEGLRHMQAALISALEHYLSYYREHKS
jgi:hypothetical protein